MKKVFFLIIGLLFSVAVFGQVEKSGRQINNSYQYALIEAARQKMIGNVNEAIMLYNNCIKANPGCDVAFYELGTIYSVLDDNKKAEAFLKSAYDIDPDNFWYSLRYSEILKENGNYDKAVEVLKRINQANSENKLTVKYKLAEIFYEKRKYRKGINVLNYIENEYGLSEMVSLMKTEIYKAKKDHKAVENELIKLIDRVPDFSGYRVVLADYYLEVKDTVKAIKAYEEACKIDSSNILVLSVLSDIYLKKKNYEKALFYLARAFSSQSINLENKVHTLILLTRNKSLMRQNSPIMEGIVISLLEKYPDNVDVLTVAYDYYNEIGKNVLAYNLIRKILEIKKDVFIIWQQALYHANLLEDYDQMITLGEEAVKYFPNKPELFLFLGLAYYQENNYEKSYLTLNEGKTFIDEDDEINLQFLFLLAESSYKVKRKSEAFGYYEKLIEKGPENDAVKNNYSYFLALEGIDLERAEQLSKETIEKNPDNDTYLDTYGWILFTMGKFEESKYYLEKALKINKESNPEILFHYAEIMYKLGDIDKAKVYYKKAQNSGFNKELVLKKLDSLNE